jgi:thioesterase domain-containing protein
VGWDEYTPSYSVATVDAHHKDIFEMPAVESLAEIIRAHTGTRDEA